MPSHERLPPVHPGEVLRHDFLEPLGHSAHALALALRLPPNRISNILGGGRAYVSGGAAAGRGVSFVGIDV